MKRRYVWRPDYLTVHCRFRSLCAARIQTVKDVYKFQDHSTGLRLDLISYKRIFFGMVELRKRARRMARQDWKQDHWLLQVAFGLCLVALAIWLVVLYRGYPIVA